ncbi:LLM class flavin-dependent oxidoreductase [Herbiconiux ginsengi]|uniref:Flavin-dependent oxidoreductase, luciferase family (Includes alkanesulfonate monooxygenase SsuD and methylene tetrahydromethanopterin reductase) n=1 Tax=Herbiconiux ginsengi TaxID=381665 RepID=A0A1H3TG42_9MICO|nr:LLM class flavin-dependent oxidoreductase [Herbiconiux ginsengi]SDZ48937.1 Flavin-dependent oxidoreductase, luciferase family (includes alkanesulfonate monooxygenase SsuD and methylene tetrahydromethanopterin reductase) [Herbiconiux ginsengi]
MKLGVFLMPSHPPERAPSDAYAFDLDVIEWADQLGFAEAWLGEHFTAPWEPGPAPDLMIAAALNRTSQIKLAPGAHLLPYHHPAALAHRLMQLDHMSGGRLMVGFGAGSVPTDFPLFGIDPSTGVQRTMMMESLEIILKIWTEEGPWKYDGEFWKVELAEEYLGFKPHMKPFQSPHPPIAIAGLTERSSSLKFAGTRGYIPLSLLFNPKYLKGHWDVYEEGAAESGQTASRDIWRIVRDVFVADTDDDAYDLTVNGNQGRQWEANMVVNNAVGWTQYLKHDPSVADEDVTVPYLAKNLWLVGAPDTVAQKLLDIYDAVGGFGTLLIEEYDFFDNPGPWRHSMELLAQEVVPRFDRLLAKRS